RRPDRKPGADVVHDAGGLFVFRSHPAVVVSRAGRDAGVGRAAAGVRGMRRMLARSSSLTVAAPLAEIGAATVRERLLLVCVSLLALFSSACIVGPKYKRPAAPMPTAFKEPPPAGWKEAQPSDEKIRGKWWELYNDPDL